MWARISENSYVNLDKINQVERRDDGKLRLFLDFMIDGDYASVDASPEYGAPIWDLIVEKPDLT